MSFTTRLLGVTAGVLAVLAHAPIASADTKHACVVASTEGQTLRDSGKLRAAREQFVTCASDACPAVVRASCATWLSDVESRIPSVVVRAEDENGHDLTQVKLIVDGSIIADRLDGRAMALDAGEHVLRVERAPGDVAEQRLLVVEREQGRVVVLRFRRARAASPPRAGDASAPRDGAPPPTTGRAPTNDSRGIPAAVWALGAVGVVAGGAFGFLGVAARNELEDLRTSCSPRCDPADVDQARAKAIVADVALGVGVVALAAAAWIYVSANASQGRPVPTTAARGAIAF